MFGLHDCSFEINIQKLNAQKWDVHARSLYEMDNIIQAF